MPHFSVTFHNSVSRFNDVQANFDEMYGVMLNLLDSFYPERTITVTSNDPSHVTAIVKMHLRRKTA